MRKQFPNMPLKLLTQLFTLIQMTQISACRIVQEATRITFASPLRTEPFLSLFFCSGQEKGN